MSVSKIPVNLLNHEDEFQEFSIPDWQLPTEEETRLQAQQAFKWSDADTDQNFVQKLLIELQTQKAKQQAQNP